MSKVIVITGPTAVGKTELSIKLAKILNGEIINADSMQIYKGMNIGTNKIKENEKCGIVHHLFDIKELDEDYNVYDYQRDGRALIEDITERGKVPVLVGGSGLYLNALLYDYSFRDKNSGNNKLLFDVVFIGLTMERALLYNRINLRVHQMIDDGLIEEVKTLYEKYPTSRALNTAIGYKEVISYLNEELDLEETTELIKQHTRNFAKRQYTWFNNKLPITWFDVTDAELTEKVCNKIKT